MNQTQVRARLRKLKGDKQLKQWSQELGLSMSFLSEVLRGSRPPTGKVLEVLGLEEVISYRRKK